MDRKPIILVDFLSISEKIKRYVIEYVVRHPETQIIVMSYQSDRVTIQESLLENAFPFDAIVTNPRTIRVPEITFKTMMLVSLLEHPEFNIILAVDTDEEALKLYKEAGIPFTLNPLEY